MRNSVEPATTDPDTESELVGRLRELRQKRRRLKRTAGIQGVSRRRVLTAGERALVHSKTAGHCHICGGPLGSRWQADHVRPRSTNRSDGADNYLPAHPLCNNYRWDYLPEEFQYILKIGVWARTHIEKATELGSSLAKAFLAHERRRLSRQKPTGREGRSKAARS